MISEIRGLADAGEAAARVFAVPSISLLIGLFLLMQAFGAFGGGGAAVSRMPFAAGADRLPSGAYIHTGIRLILHC